MAKRLILSPELLLIAPLPAQRRGVGQALRALVMDHGEMPIVVSPNTVQGEACVVDETGFVHNCVRFQIEDWHIPEPVLGRRVAI
ncbi:MAG: hypothetical protein JWP02_3564 [Acidimicrobiales bacterium]|nr:hypothetical protein [Acidimicrobiales bacterium]